jgi:hypothetical protein
MTSCAVTRASGPRGRGAEDHCPRRVARFCVSSEAMDHRAVGSTALDVDGDVIEVAEASAPVGQTDTCQRVAGVQVHAQAGDTGGCDAAVSFQAATGCTIEPLLAS